MGASLALAASVAGCRWEKREIRPFAKRPADRVPGEPQQFATTMDMAGSALGLLVTCVDGRPIKVEGNPRAPVEPRGDQRLRPGGHPGALRSRPQQGDHPADRRPRGGPQLGRVFRLRPRAFCASSRKNGGEGLRVLSEASSSPTLERMRGELLKAVPEGEMACLRADSAVGRTSGDSEELFLRPDVRPTSTRRCLPGCGHLRIASRLVRNARDFASGRDAAAGRDEPALCGREHVFAHRRRGRSSSGAAVQGHCRGGQSAGP